MAHSNLYFLPSEVARLVLGYLQSEGYTKTYKNFVKECPNLGEYVNFMKRGHHYPLTINGLALVQMLEEYGSLRNTEIAKKTSTNPALSSLWHQFDTVVERIRKNVASNCKFVYSGHTSQQSRTRMQLVDRRRNQLKSATVTIDPDVIQPHTTKPPVAPLVVTQYAVSNNISTSRPAAPSDDDSGQDDGGNDSDHGDQMQMAVDEPAGGTGNVELPSLLHTAHSSLSPSPKPTVGDTEQSETSKVPDCSTMNGSTALPSDEVAMVTDTRADSVVLVSSEKVSVDDEDVHNVPETPVKSSSPTPGLHTPVKQLISVDPGLDKSPRRKRPPKRKSQGELRRQNKSDTNLVHDTGSHNESSNSNDGAALESSFPQILEQMLNDPLLPHKLAENINKSLHPDVNFDPGTPATLPPVDAVPESPFMGRSLEDILDQQETQMPASSINGIIELTEKDPNFEWLFSAGVCYLDEAARDLDFTDYGRKGRSNGIQPPASNSSAATGSKMDSSHKSDLSFAGLTSRAADPFTDHTTNYVPMTENDGNDLFKLSVPNFPNPSSFISTNDNISQYSTAGNVPSVTQYPIIDSVTSSIPSHQPMTSCVTSTQSSVMTNTSLCVTAQALTTVVTSHQPIASQPSCQPITTAVTSIQPITSSFSSGCDVHSNVMIKSTVTSPHGFPVLSLKTSVNDNDLPDPLSSFSIESPTKTHVSATSQPHSNEERGSVSSNSYTSFMDSVGDGTHSSTPITGHPSGLILPSISDIASSPVFIKPYPAVPNTSPMVLVKPRSVVPSTSPKSLPTINIRSLLDKLEAKAKGQIVEIDLRLRPVSRPSETRRGRRKNPPPKKCTPKAVQPKPLNPPGREKWSPELSALMKIASPEKSTPQVTQTSNSTPQPNSKSAPQTRSTIKKTKAKKTETTFMAVLSPSGRTVHHVPVTEVNSLSEFDDANDLVPVGQLLSTNLSLGTPSSSSSQVTMPTTQTLMTSLPQSVSAQSISVMSVPLQTISGVTTSLSSQTVLTCNTVSMATSTNVPCSPSDAPKTPNSGSLSTEYPSMPDLFGRRPSLPVAATTSGQSSPMTSDRSSSQHSTNPDRVLNDVYSADRDFLESPSSTYGDSGNVDHVDRGMETDVNSLTDNLYQYCGIPVEIFPNKDFSRSVQQPSQQGTSSPVRQLSYGRGRKNNSTTGKPGRPSKRGKSQPIQRIGDSSTKSDNSSTSTEIESDQSKQFETDTVCQSMLPDGVKTRRSHRLSQKDKQPSQRNEGLPQQGHGPVQRVQLPSEHVQDTAQQHQEPAQQDWLPSQHVHGTSQQVQGTSQQARLPSRQVQGTSQQHQEPTQQYQEPAQQDRLPSQQHRKSAQHDLLLSQQVQGTSQQDRLSSQQVQGTSQQDRLPSQQVQGTSQQDRLPSQQVQGTSQQHQEPTQHDLLPSQQVHPTSPQDILPQHQEQLLSPQDCGLPQPTQCLVQTPQTSGRWPPETPLQAPSPYSQAAYTPRQDMDISPASTPNQLRICTPSDTDQTPTKEVMPKHQVVTVGNVGMLSLQEVVRSPSCHDSASRDSFMSHCVHSPVTQGNTRANTIQTRKESFEEPNKTVSAQKHVSIKYTEDIVDSQQISSTTSRAVDIPSPLDTTQSEISNAVASIQENVSMSEINNAIESIKEIDPSSVQKEILSSMTCNSTDTHRVHIPENLRADLETQNLEPASISSVPTQLKVSIPLHVLHQLVKTSDKSSLVKVRTQGQRSSDTEVNFHGHRSGLDDGTPQSMSNTSCQESTNPQISCPSYSRVDARTMEQLKLVGNRTTPSTHQSLGQPTFVCDNTAMTSSPTVTGLQQVVCYPDSEVNLAQVSPTTNQHELPSRVSPPQLVKSPPAVVTQRPFIAPATPRATSSTPGQIVLSQAPHVIQSQYSPSVSAPVSQTQFTGHSSASYVINSVAPIVCQTEFSDNPPEPCVFSSPAPVVSQTQFMANSPAPVVSQTQFMANSPAPVVSQTQFMANSPAPVVSQTQFMASSPAPVVSQTQFMANSPVPVVSQTQFMASSPAPVVSQTQFMANHVINLSIPVVSPAQFIANSPAPVVSQTQFIANSPAPVVSQTQFIANSPASHVINSSVPVVSPAQFIANSPAPQVTNSSMPIVTTAFMGNSPVSYVIHSVAPVVSQSQFTANSPALINTAPNLVSQKQFTVNSPAPVPHVVSTGAPIVSPAQFIVNSPVGPMIKSPATPLMVSSPATPLVVSSPATPLIVHSPANPIPIVPATSYKNVRSPAPQKLSSRAATPQMEPTDFIPDRTGTIYVTPNVLAQMACEKRMVVQESAAPTLVQGRGVDKTDLRGPEVGQSPRGQYQSDQDIFAETTDDEVADPPSILPAPSKLSVITEVSHDIAKIPSLFDTMDGNNQVIKQCHDDSRLQPSEESRGSRSPRYFSALSNETPVCEESRDELIQRRSDGNNLPVGKSDNIVTVNTDDTVSKTLPSSDSDEDIDILGDWYDDLSAEQGQACVIGGQTISHDNVSGPSTSRNPAKQPAWQTGFVTNHSSANSAFVRKILEKRNSTSSSCQEKKESAVCTSSVSLQTLASPQKVSAMCNPHSAITVPTKNQGVATEQQSSEKVPRRVQVITLSKEVSKVSKDFQNALQSARGPFKHPQEFSPRNISHNSGKSTSNAKHSSVNVTKSTGGHTAGRDAAIHQQYITPPKKRFMASLKAREGLYFESSVDKCQNTGDHSSHNTSAKVSQPVSSPRRSRKATLTPRKDLDAAHDSTASKSRTSDRTSRSPGHHSRSSESRVCRTSESPSHSDSRNIERVSASPRIRRKVFETDQDSRDNCRRSVDRTSSSSSGVNKSTTSSSRHREASDPSVSGSRAKSPRRATSPNPKRGHKRPEESHHVGETKAKRAKKGKTIDLTKLDVDKFLNSDIYKKGRQDK